MAYTHIIISVGITILTFIIFSIICVLLLENRTSTEEKFYGSFGCFGGAISCLLSCIYLLYFHENVFIFTINLMHGVLSFGDLKMEELIAFCFCIVYFIVFIWYGILGIIRYREIEWKVKTN